jgi:acyl-CoA dehydrogenase
VLDKLGMKSQDTSELFFDDVTVPAANLLGGNEGQGFFQLMGDLPYERLIIGVTALACMEGAYEATLAYVRERKAFGKPIGDLQNTRFKLAEVATNPGGPRPAPKRTATPGTGGQQRAGAENACSCSAATAS